MASRCPLIPHDHQRVDRAEVETELKAEHLVYAGTSLQIGKPPDSLMRLHRLFSTSVFKYTPHSKNPLY